MLQAPNAFHGTWRDLYQRHIEGVLPPVDDVCRVHEWMAQYCDEPGAIFPVRAVTGAERQKLYTTIDGTQIAPADNSPAWVTHALLMQKRLSSYRDFRHAIFTMPTHMFEISRYVRQTANQCGWYVAHVFPAKNGDTNFRRWERREVERRFYLTLHPCNLFFVPGVRNRAMGEDPSVIRFIASQYAMRYAVIWSDFLQRVKARTLDTGHRDLGSAPVAFNSDLNATVPPVSDAVSPSSLQAGTPRASYRASRLTFKRDQIEPLKADEVFEVVTPFGIYRFTKRDFYSEFANIPRTISYREHGLYHGATLHLKAQRFRIAD